MTDRGVACRACGVSTSDPDRFEFDESMYGTGETFTYVRCHDCGSLSLPEPPGDLGHYYAGSYYSHAEPAPVGRLRTFAARFLYRTRVGRWMPFLVPGFVRWTLRAGIDRDARILDVGSGSGDILLAMSEAGFRNLEGIDPFMGPSELRRGAVTLRRQELAETRGSYDLIMMNHSLEHVHDPLRMLLAAADRLEPGGVLLVRIPVVDSFAWRRYREHWVQLDPPRHLTLFTRKAAVAAGLAAGLRVRRIDEDSTAFQFWGSRERRCGVALDSPESRARDGFRTRTLDVGRWGWHVAAHAVNLLGRGDAVALYFEKPDRPSSQVGPVRSAGSGA